MSFRRPKNSTRTRIVRILSGVTGKFHCLVLREAGEKHYHQRIAGMEFDGMKILCAREIFYMTAIVSELRSRACVHPFFSFVHGFIDLVKAFDGKQNFMNLIHLHGSIQDFVQMESP